MSVKETKWNWWGMLRTPLAFVWNILLVYVVYWLCRLAYLAENHAAFEGLWSHNSLSDLLAGAWRFDTSAIVYTNVLYALLMLLPLTWKERPGWQRAARWVFVVVNGLAVCINLADAAYFPFTGRRTTASVFSEFQNESNLGNIFAVELLRHWYLVVVAVALIALLCWAYKNPIDSKSADKPLFREKGSSLRYCLIQLLCLLAYLPFCIGGMRGGLSHAVRPITISNASQYVSRPAEAAFVLNTPFSLLRTWGKKTFVIPDYFSSEEEMESIYSPVHGIKDSPPALPDSPPALPVREGAECIRLDENFILDEGLQPSRVTAPSLTGRAGGESWGAWGESAPRNIVILIVESFGREYIGALNETLEGGRYEGYTPFVDELCDSSATFRWSFCNGRKSIDGMPSILSSIPMFIEPFFLTPASMNTVSGLADVLGRQGYQTAFFHGAENGSMGFQAFARKTGFQRYFGRTEYNQDPRFRGDEDYDGIWAIWDEPFLQFYAQQMSQMQEPFMTAVFTASSHHPFRIPEELRDTFPEGPLVIHKCIRYTDHALRRFFQTARRQPWFQRTIFVLTSDHTNLSDHPFYQTAIGGFCSPIIFYDPSGQLFRPGRRDAIAQQIDIMPTVLSLTGMGRQPYVAFGCDLTQTPPEDTWAVNYNNGIYQYAKHGLLLQMDGATSQTRAVYALTDSLLQHNLLGQRAEQPRMELELRAIIQQYMTRMNQDRLTCSETEERGK